MEHIAILGMGVVGGGVAELVLNHHDLILKQNKLDINIKYILDLRSFPDHPLGDRVISNIDTIINDKDVTVVAEMLGGLHPAYEFTVASLKAGKNVVTSNKAVVAEYGVELLKLARDNGVRYMFEASVGGGIPIIRSLTDYIQTGDVYEIAGILNGTTNYILTSMAEQGVSFGDALAEAQKLGYAEKNPTDDVEGFDACRKICILAAIVSGKLIPFKTVPTEGISKVTQDMIKDAAAKGGVLKLIAKAVFEDGKEPVLSVKPEIVMADSPLYGVRDVYNGILVRAHDHGDLMFYGKGAGKLPTAGAVLADIIDLLSCKDKQPEQNLWHE